MANWVEVGSGEVTLPGGINITFGPVGYDPDRGVYDPGLVIREDVTAKEKFPWLWIAVALVTGAVAVAILSK